MVTTAMAVLLNLGVGRVLCAQAVPYSVVIRTVWGGTWCPHTSTPTAGAVRLGGVCASPTAGADLQMDTRSHPEFTGCSEKDSTAPTPAAFGRDSAPAG